MTKKRKISTTGAPGPRIITKTAVKRTTTRRAAPQRRSDDGIRWIWLVTPLVIFSALLAVLFIRSGAGSRGPLPAGTETVTELNRNHVQGTVAYDRVPPVGGNHAPVWLNCGIYDQPVPNENAVHSMEHGAVWITYQSSISTADVATLRSLVQSKDTPGRYVILSPYSGLPSPIVLTAWGNQLRVPSASDERIGQFIDYFRTGPQDLEPGAACSGGGGQPVG